MQPLKINTKSYLCTEKKYLFIFYKTIWTHSIKFWNVWLVRFDVYKVECI